MVSARLGHSSVATTQQIYVHSFAGLTAREPTAAKWHPHRARQDSGNMLRMESSTASVDLDREDTGGVGVAWRIAAVVAGLAGLGLLAFVHEFAHVVDRGKDLLPWSADVVKIRFGESWTLYVDVQPQPPADIVNGVLLAAGGAAAVMAALLLRWTRALRQLTVFYALIGGALIYLAFDELAAIHETVGHNLPFLTELPGVKSPDIAVFAAYAFPVGYLVWRFRNVLSDEGPARRLLILAAALFVAAVGADVLSLPGEEALELTSTLVGLAALARMLQAHLSEALGSTQPTPASI